MNIIFMGSPEFAVPALSSLINSQHTILAVYTQPPKPAGRGYKEKLTAIHELANKHNITVRTPKNFKKNSTIEELKSLNADLAVVVAYGIILPQTIIDIPKHGAVNIHPSRLPKLRGAAPLQRTILEGEKETSICIIKMDSGIDTGDILISQDMTLEKDINIIELHDRTAVIGSELLLQVIDNFADIKPIKQSIDGDSYAAKISKEEAKLDWQNDDASFIDRKIRALNPFPGTYFFHQEKIIKVKSALYEETNHSFNPGMIINDQFWIACKGGIIKPQIMQREGKREMPISEFIKGFNFKIGDVL